MRKCKDFFQVTEQTLIDRQREIKNEIRRWRRGLRLMLPRTRDFLRRFYGNRVEAERNGRTDIRMASELCQEVLDMIRRDKAERRVISRIKKNADYAEWASMPCPLRWLQYERMVEAEAQNLC